MHIAAQVVALVVVVLVVSWVARRLDWPAPLCLIAVGVAASYVPGVPGYHLSPEVVLVGLLPPLLYSAAIQTSLLDFRKLRGPIATLSVGLVRVHHPRRGARRVGGLPACRWPRASRWARWSRRPTRSRPAPWRTGSACRAS